MSELVSWFDELGLFDGWDPPSLDDERVEEWRSFHDRVHTGPEKEEYPEPPPERGRRGKGSQRARSPNMRRIREGVFCALDASCAA